MSLLAKQEAMAKLIEQSHAKKETKEKVGDAFTVITHQSRWDDF